MSHHNYLIVIQHFSAQPIYIFYECAQHGLILVHAEHMEKQRGMKWGGREEFCPCGPPNRNRRHNVKVVSIVLPWVFVVVTIFNIDNINTEMLVAR